MKMAGRQRNFFSKLTADTCIESPRCQSLLASPGISYIFFHSSDYIQKLSASGPHYKPVAGNKLVLRGFCIKTSPLFSFPRNPYVPFFFVLFLELLLCAHNFLQLLFFLLPPKMLDFCVIRVLQPRENRIQQKHAEVKKFFQFLQQKSSWVLLFSEFKSLSLPLGSHLGRISLNMSFLYEGGNLGGMMVPVFCPRISRVFIELFQVFS